MRCLFLFVCLASIIMSAGYAFGITHHVYAGGSIQNAINSAVDGDIIIVHPGTYREPNDIVIQGTPGNRRTISLIAEAGPDVTALGPLSAVSGSGTAIRIIWGLNVQISGFTIQGYRNYGIQTLNSEDTRIFNNIIVDNASSGIDVPGRPEDLPNTVYVDGNTIAFNGYGILHSGGAHITAYNNVVWGCDRVEPDCDIQCPSAKLLADVHCNLVSYRASCLPSSNIVETSNPFGSGWHLLNDTRSGCGRIGACFTACACPVPGTGPITASLPGAGESRCGFFHQGPITSVRDEAGNALELSCEPAGGFLTFEFRYYYVPSGGPKRLIGRCPWEFGDNYDWFHHAGDSDQDSEVDCFLQFGTEGPWTTRWRSVEPGTGQGMSNTVDWFQYTFLHEHNRLTLEYYTSVDGPGGSAEDVLMAMAIDEDPLCFPACGSEGRIAGSTIDPGAGHPDDMLLLRLAPCDNDQDGDCDDADYELVAASVGRCREGSGYNALADADGDGCVTQGDLERLFPGTRSS